MGTVTWAFGSAFRAGLPVQIGMGLALLAAVAPSHAATRTGTLSVSLTIASSCLVRTSPTVTANSLEQAFLSGTPARGVTVRCTAATPFLLSLDSATRRSNPAMRVGSSVAPFYESETTSLHLRTLLSPDSPTTLIDTPSRLIAQPIDAAPTAGITAMEQGEPDSAKADHPPRRMLVVTY